METKARILFIADHREGRAPNQRYRFEQYLGHLRENGFECVMSPLISAEDDRLLYSRGNHFAKLRMLSRMYAIRRRDLQRMDRFDIIFICRQALMTRSTFFEKAFRKGRAKLIYDFDDAIWLQSVSEANRRWSWLKDPGKTAELISLADQVIAGNDFLAGYARRSNGNVNVIPSTIDTDRYRPKQHSQKAKVVIGWSGSITTVQHFLLARPALIALRKRFGKKIHFRLIGDPTFTDPELGVEVLPWNASTEVQDLEPIDIGLMPLPDNEWARGKCGMKGLQYMGLGIPPVMSPVGVNTSIVTDGVNGFLAASTEEWVEKIGRLIEDADLRARMGAEARKTVVMHYSVKAWRNEYLRLFKQLLQQ